MSREEYILPIVKKVLDQIGDKPIVSTRKSPVPKMVTHDNEIVGVYKDSGEVEWFDTPKAEEAKKLLDK